MHGGKEIYSAKHLRSYLLTKTVEKMEQSQHGDSDDSLYSF